MKRLIFVTAFFLSIFGQADAATIGPGVYTFVAFPSPVGPIVGRFSFLPDAIELARKAGKTTAVVNYDDLVEFDLVDTKAKVEFLLTDVLPTFALSVRFFPHGNSHVYPYGDTSVLAVSGRYSMSFVNGLDVLLNGPRGETINHGTWGWRSAYVPLPAPASLLVAASCLLALLRKRRRA